MIRFGANKYTSNEEMKTVVLADNIKLDKNIWSVAQGYFNNNINFDIMTLQLCGFISHDERCKGYVYQDVEANRELRMLNEIEENKMAYQFGDIYPNINKVIILGCNELACCFAEYLEMQNIITEKLGLYWEYLGYENALAYEVDENTMIIYAEGSENYKSSVSSEFECIDHIYEKNVLDGKIKDTSGDFSWFIENIRGKDIFIIGTDDVEQDAYDLLLENGIDICGFLNLHEVENCKSRQCRLLCKEIYSLNEVVENFQEPIFIDCENKNSALGDWDIEYLYSFGYKRNRDIFYILDYIEIQHSNLLNIIKGRDVLLVGDEKLCGMLSEYLYKVEKGNINIRYSEFPINTTCSEDTILCDVYIRYGGTEENINRQAHIKQLAENGLIDCTKYYSSIKSFYFIEKFLNRSVRKYKSQIRPKGIVIARIPAYSGNDFMNGIMDGHPEIIRMASSTFSKNLFQYCIRLSKLKSSLILNEFWKLFVQETSVEQMVEEFENKKLFDESVKKQLEQKEYFTSQELFVVFHIAFNAMYNNGKGIDISDKLIWWEPHQVPRGEFDYLAKWLESDDIEGFTFCMVRDNSVRFGSVCKRAKKELYSIADSMFYDASEIENNVPYDSWNEIKLRFEDVKLRPNEKLSYLCEKLKITWSETLLSITDFGTECGYSGRIGFDLQPVFNKYEKYISEFDRLRVYIASRQFQKRYGYPYEDGLKFTRKELYKMFSKEYRFCDKYSKYDKEHFHKNHLIMNEIIRWNLWRARKKELLEEVSVVFPPLAYGQLTEMNQKILGEERKKVIDYVGLNENIILYGTGKDCEGILQQMENNSMHAKLLFCDKRAEIETYYFHGEKVLPPSSLVEDYNEYKILITSSQYYKIIQRQLATMGIISDRIFCNTVQFWDAE